MKASVVSKALRDFAVAAALLIAGAASFAAPALGPAGLRLRHTSLALQLAQNAYGGPLYIESGESARRIEGDVYAVVHQPFGKVARALSDPQQWCEILILHLNNKDCRRQQEDGAVKIDLRVGGKHEESIDSASLLRFTWRQPVVQPDYVHAELRAPEGPYDTRDYRLLVEAVPLKDERTFLHMGYAFGYGGASRFAMHLYLSTIGRDKVGFTAGEDGVRGVVERNAMRYYLAIEAYLGSLSLPPAQQLESRLQAWFDATEKYPRQLHEVSRDEYLRMKRNEWRRQMGRKAAATG